MKGVAAGLTLAVIALGASWLLRWLATDPAQPTAVSPAPPSPTAPAPGSVATRPAEAHRGDLAAPDQPTLDRVAGSASPARARVQAFLAGFSGEADASVLLDPYLGNIDLDALTTALRRSQTSAADLRASLVAADVEVIPPSKRALAMLAMAYADGFGDTDAAFLCRTVLDSDSLFATNPQSPQDADALLAAGHALRLRGRISDLLGPELQDAWDRGRAANPTAMQFGAAATLLEMVLGEARADDAVALTIASLVAEEASRRGGSRSASSRLLLAADEVAYRRRIEGALGPNGDGAIGATGLSVMYEERHIGYLQRILSMATQEKRMQSAADGAALGLAASGQPQAIDAALQWLRSSGERSSIDVQALAGSLPIDVMVRCGAHLSGHEDGGPLTAGIRSALAEATSQRVDARRLSPSQRDSVRAQVRSMLTGTTLRPHGLEYCFTVMARIGILDDCAMLHEAGLRCGLQEAADRATAAIRQRN